MVEDFKFPEESEGDDTDFYTEKGIEKGLNDGDIEAEDGGFMLGYLAD